MSSLFFVQYDDVEAAVSRKSYSVNMYLPVNDVHSTATSCSMCVIIHLNAVMSDVHSDIT